MTTPPPLKGRALLEFLEKHLVYELESLGASLAVLLRQPRDQPEYRVAVEALVLHARLLHEFFAKSDRGLHQTDVLAIDAVPADKWAPERILNGEQLNMAHRLLAHMSSDRGPNAGYAWPAIDIVNASVGVAERWAMELPPGETRQAVDEKCEWIRSLIP